MIYLGGFVFLAFCLLLYLMRKDTLKRGEYSQDVKTKEESLKEVDRVLKARDELRRNSSMRDKLRDKYTRK